MTTNRTFTMIKPDAVANGHIGAILNDITSAGFKIIALKYTKLTEETAGKFYEVHAARPFYKDLVGFMSSGPIVAAILEKDNAIEDFRKLIGATNPAKLLKVPSAENMPNRSMRMPYMDLIQMKMLPSKVISSSPQRNVSNQKAKHILIKKHIIFFFFFFFFFFL